MAKQKANRTIRDSVTGLPVLDVPVYGEFLDSPPPNYVENTFEMEVPPEKKDKTKKEKKSGLQPLNPSGLSGSGARSNISPVDKEQPTPKIEKKSSLIDDLWNYLKPREQTETSKKVTGLGEALRELYQKESDEPDRDYDFNANITEGDVTGGIMRGDLKVENNKVYKKDSKIPVAQITTSGKIEPIKYSSFTNDNANLGIAGLLSTLAVPPLVAPYLINKGFDAFKLPSQGEYTDEEVRAIEANPNTMKAFGQGLANYGMGSNPYSITNEIAYPAGEVVNMIGNALAGGGATAMAKAPRIVTAAAGAVPSVLSAGSDVADEEVTPFAGLAQAGGDIAGNFIGLKAFKNVQNLVRQGTKTPIGVLLSPQTIGDIAKGTGITLFGSTPSMIQKSDEPMDVVTAIAMSAGLMAILGVATTIPDAMAAKGTKVLQKAFANDIKKTADVYNNTVGSHDEKVAAVLNVVSETTTERGGLTPEMYAKKLKMYYDNLNEQGVKPSGNVDMTNPDVVVIDKPKPQQPPAQSKQSSGSKDLALVRKIGTLKNNPKFKSTLKEFSGYGLAVDKKSNVELSQEDLVNNWYKIASKYTGKTKEELTPDEVVEAVTKTINRTDDIAGVPFYMDRDDSLDEAIDKAQALKVASTNTDENVSLVADKALANAELGVIYRKYEEALDLVFDKADDPMVAKRAWKKENKVAESKKEFIKKHEGKKPEEIKAEIKEQMSTVSSYDDAVGEQKAVVEAKNEAEFKDALAEEMAKADKGTPPEVKQGDAIVEELAAINDTALQEALRNGGDVSDITAVENAVGQYYAANSDNAQSVYTSINQTADAIANNNLEGGAKFLADQQVNKLRDLANNIESRYLETPEMAAENYINEAADELNQVDLDDKQIIAGHAYALYNKMKDDLQAVVKGGDIEQAQELTWGIKTVYNTMQQLKNGDITPSEAASIVDGVSNANSVVSDLSSAVMSNEDIKRGVVGGVLGAAGALMREDENDPEYNSAYVGIGDFLLWTGLATAGTGLARKYIQRSNRLQNSRFMKLNDGSFNEALKEVGTGNAAADRIVARGIKNGTDGVNPRATLYESIKESELIPSELKPSIISRLTGQAIAASEIAKDVARALYGKPTNNMVLRMISKNIREIAVDVPRIVDGQVQYVHTRIDPKALVESMNETGVEASKNINHIRALQNQALHASGGVEGYTVDFKANLYGYTKAVELKLQYKDGLISEEEYNYLLSQVYTPENIDEYINKAAAVLYGSKYPVGSSKYNKLVSDAKNGWGKFRESHNEMTKIVVDNRVRKAAGKSLAELSAEEEALTKKKVEIKEKRAGLKALGLVRKIKVKGKTKTEVMFKEELKEVNDKLKLIRDGRRFLKESQQNGYVNNLDAVKEDKTHMVRFHQVDENGNRTQNEAGQMRVLDYTNSYSQAKEMIISKLESWNAVAVPGQKDVYIVDALSNTGEVTGERVPIQVVTNNLDEVKKNKSANTLALISTLQKLSNTATFDRVHKNETASKLKDIINQLEDSGIEDEIDIRTIKKEIDNIVTEATSDKDLMSITNKISDAILLSKGNNLNTPSHNFYGGANAINEAGELEKIALATPQIEINKQVNTAETLQAINWLSNTLNVMRAVGIDPRNELSVHYEKLLNVATQPYVSGVVDINTPFGGTKSINISKTLNTATQTLSASALAVNPASAIRNMADAFVMSTLTDLYTSGRSPVGTIKKFGKGFVAELPPSIFKNVKRAQASIFKNYDALAETYESSSDEIVPVLKQLDELLASANNEGITDYIDNSLYAPWVLDGMYSFTRLSDRVTRKFVAKDAALEWMHSNPIKTGQTMDNYLTQAANHAKIITDGVHGRYKLLNYNPNFAIFKQNPWLRWVTVMMSPWAHKMSVVNTIARDAISMNSENGLRAATALGAMGIVGTLIGGVAAVPLMSDYYAALKTADKLTPGQKNSIDPTPYEDLWIKAMDVATNEFNLSEDEAIQLKKLIEYGFISTTLGVNLSMDDAYGMPFIASKISTFADAVKNPKSFDTQGRLVETAGVAGNASDLLQKALYPFMKVLIATMAKNVWMGYGDYLTGETKRYDFSNEYANVEMSTTDRIRTAMFGEPLESLIERKNKIHGGTPLDTQAERENFYSKMLNSGGRTLQGKNGRELKDMARLSPYLNKHAYGVRSALLAAWQDEDMIMPLKQSEDMFDKWVSENRDKIKDKMLKGSEAETYTVEVDKKIGDMRNRIREYYITEVVMNVMNSYINAANKHGEKLPPVIRTKNNVKGLPFGEQGFNYVIRDYK